MRIAQLTAPLLMAAALLAQNGSPTRPLDVPYVPSPNPVVEAMLTLAGVKSTDTVLDLGCGDGRIVITAAKNYGAHARGVDLNPERIAEARTNAAKAGVESLVTFEEKDLFDTDLHDASVVTLYLLPEVNLKLRPKLMRDLKSGARVVSHTFTMGDWKPDKEALVEGRHVYLWIIPEKK